MNDISFIRLPCSGCGVHLRIGIENGGKQVQCPTCQSMTKSPRREQLPYLVEKVNESESSMQATAEEQEDGLRPQTQT